ncbi:MAG TPA: hypothetical protein VJL39_01550 [Candidatus Paceibacterota bacterium]
MQPQPVNSFAKFTLGFLTFLSVSFGVTYAVSTLAEAKDADQAAAAALAQMLVQAE